ncbi:nucleoside triphosphate pyrophosphohydrolase [Leptospira yanagawae]|uniref:nucleoside triphosphate pyrophosphohydrolase n=1 Tax=Leptospira yanagawae TaxID=293069 RepID=UPI000684E9EA|nr:nucleoside triphosphate pyrophosphohydrolase [Leptospira yanagawae]
MQFLGSRSTGRTPNVRKLGKNEFKIILYEKLIEEHAELIKDNTISEVVDMIEVLLAIGNEIGYSEDNIMEELRKKRASNGAFQERNYLISIN